MDKEALAIMDSYMEFEKLRGVYNESNACELQTDTKNGVYPCKRSGVTQVFLALVVAMAGGVF